MFHIKICGVRQVDDIRAVAEAGADAIGMNFYPPSIRFMDPNLPQAVAISQAASAADLLRVGVFVNPRAEEVERIVELLGIDAVQFHGDETVQFVNSLIGTSWFRDRGLRVIRAIKLPLGKLTVEQIAAAAQPWVEIGCHPLFDAEAGSAHGGSGQSLDWESIGRWQSDHPLVRFTLAGGLTPENVVEAIEQSHAHSVDTASGVEQPRGQKSRNRINSFVRACRSAPSWQAS